MDVFEKAFDHARKWTSFSQKFEGWLFGNLAELQQIAVEFNGEIIWNEDFFDEYDAKLQIVFSTPTFELSEALWNSSFVNDYSWDIHDGIVTLSLTAKPTPYPIGE